MAMTDAALRPILDFLWYGYVPSEAVAEAEFARYRALLDDDSVATFDGRSVRAARDLLCRIVDERTWRQGVREVRLGLTAGLDSRGILGALLEIFPASAIVGYTFGHRGAEDFELARSFTKGVLPRHILLDVVAHEWTTEGAVQTVAARAPDAVLEVGEFYGVRYDPAFTEVLHLTPLTGFLGDALSGKKLPRIVSGRWADAVDMFVRASRTFKGDVAVLPERYDPAASLPGDCFRGGGRMLLNDQLQFPVRQEQRIRPLFRAQEGTPCINPYDDPRWVRSFLLLPVAQRHGQAFYKRLLARSFPKIFPDLEPWRAAPPAASSEISVNRPSGGPVSTALHVDFAHVFRTNAGFRAFCRENLGDLHARRVLPWLDLPALLREAEAGRLGNFGRIFYGLVSLEINLKAGRLQAP